MRREACLAISLRRGQREACLGNLSPLWHEKRRADEQPQRRGRWIYRTFKGLIAATAMRPFGMASVLVGVRSDPYMIMCYFCIWRPRFPASITLCPPWQNASCPGQLGGKCMHPSHRTGLRPICNCLHIDGGQVYFSVSSGFFSRRKELRWVSSTPSRCKRDSSEDMALRSTQR